MKYAPYVNLRIRFENWLLLITSLLTCIALEGKP